MIRESLILSRYVRYLIHLLSFIGLLLFVSSCGIDPVSAKDAIGLLTKCKEFLSFCVLLLGLGTNVPYSYIAERYYYAMLCLARIVAGKERRLLGEDKKGKHERIWKACPAGVNLLFGVRLKELRVRCDYGLQKEDLLNHEYKNELLEIVRKDDEYNSLREAVKDEALYISSRQDFAEEYSDLLEMIDDLNYQIKQRIMGNNNVS